MVLLHSRVSIQLAGPASSVSRYMEEKQPEEVLMLIVTENINHRAFAKMGGDGKNFSALM